jgi:hypothetical protein
MCHPQAARLAIGLRASGAAEGKILARAFLEK